MDALALNDKFSAAEGSFTFTYGGMDMYHAGLEGLLVFLMNVYSSTNRPGSDGYSEGGRQDVGGGAAPEHKLARLDHPTSDG